MPPDEPTLEELSTGLVDDVRGGVDGAWERLVDQFEKLVLAIPHELGLPEADCEEVFQLTWISLYQQVQYIKRPGALVAWITTTARRQALRLRMRQRRTAGLPPAPEREDDADDGVPDPLQQSIELEERRLVQECVALLGAPCGELLRLLSDERSYDGVAAELDIPRGSVGPMRGRCLARLARLLEARGLA